MDIRQLRYFVKIAEEGGFSQAARRLHVAQPALSHHVHVLEQELGIQLLERHARGVRLTEPGERLLDHARLVLRQLEAAREEVTNLAESARGTVHIGLATAVSMVLTIPLIEATSRRLPDVELKVVETMSGFLKEWLLGGKLDIAVLYNVDGHEGFRIEPLLHEDLCLVAPPDDPVSDAESIPLASLADFPLILPGMAHGLRLFVDSLAATQGMALRVIFDLDSTVQIVKFVARGCGFSILSPAAIHDAVRHGEVRALPIVDPAMTRSVVLATLGGGCPNRATEAVRALIVEVVRQLVADGIWDARSLA